MRLLDISVLIFVSKSRIIAALSLIGLSFTPFVSIIEIMHYQFFYIMIIITLAIRTEFTKIISPLSICELLMVSFFSDFTTIIFIFWIVYYLTVTLYAYMTKTFIVEYEPPLCDDHVAGFFFSRVRKIVFNIIHSKGDVGNVFIFGLILSIFYKINIMSILIMYSWLIYGSGYMCKKIIIIDGKFISNTLPEMGYMTVRSSVNVWQFGKITGVHGTLKHKVKSGFKVKHPAKLIKFEDVNGVVYKFLTYNTNNPVNPGDSTNFTDGAYGKSKISIICKQDEIINFVEEKNSFLDLWDIHHTVNAMASLHHSGKASYIDMKKGLKMHMFLKAIGCETYAGQIAMYENWRGGFIVSEEKYEQLKNSEELKKESDITYKKCGLHLKNDDDD